MLAKDPAARPPMQRVAAELDAIGHVSVPASVHRQIRLRAIVLICGALVTVAAAGAAVATAMVMR
jgi:hypothetical protein